MLECVNFMAARGHETHAFAQDWDVASLSPDVVRHTLRYRARIPALALPAYRRAAQRAIAALDPPADVVAGFGAGAPEGSVVWMQSVHAAWIEIARGTRGPAGRLRQRVNPFHPVALRMERRQLTGGHYSKLIALTPDVKADIVRIYGVPSDDIEILPNGYSAAEFHPPTADLRREMRQRLGYADHHKVVVFVANELERKGFTPLLRAVSLLRDESVRILAVGRLREAEARPEIERLGLTGRVQLTGPTNDVADYYAASDVFALPTKYEAWGLVIVEALACGLPVLTSTLAGASVAVRPGENGQLVDDPADPEQIERGLRSLLSGEHLSRDEVSRSVEAYEWSRLLLRYETILTEHIR
jgi:UDP-glucose:(heptosyl)LPS alpha-1,3-glucosyltransferase